MTVVKPMNALFMAEQFLPNLPCKLTKEQLRRIKKALKAYNKACEDAAKELESNLLAIVPKPKHKK